MNEVSSLPELVDPTRRRTCLVVIQVDKRKGGPSAAPGLQSPQGLGYTKDANEKAV